MTRAAAGEDSAIENVLLLLFDESGKLTNKAYQELIEDNNSVSIYMTAVDGQTLYALCNVPEDADVLDANAEATNTYTLDNLKEEYIKIEDPEGAYTGKYVMSGDTLIELENSMLKKEYTVKVKRLAAKLDFDIQFTPTERGDNFLIHGVFMHNIPMDSKLLEVEQTDTLKKCEENIEYYEEDSLRIDYTEPKARKVITPLSKCLRIGKED